MFELNYPAFVNVLSSIEKLEEELKEVFVSHQGSVTNLEQNWYGATSMFERNHMMEALSTGSYYRAGKYTTGIKKIMEDYQLLIQQLMARREQLGKQLMQDEYEEPDLSYHTEDDLIIEYSQIEVLKGNCNMAKIYGNSAAGVVEDMMEEALKAASEWVNFGDADAVLEKGKRKINRLGNFITELTLFKSLMTSLEYDLIYDMYAVIKELGDTELEFTEFKPPIAEPQQMITSAEGVRFIELDEVEKVLAMDAEEWTVDDAMYIVGAWNYCLEQKDTEMMNAIVQALFIVDDTTYCTDMGIFPDIYTDYMEAEVDVEKIQLLLANMDPVTNLQAYQSLYNLTNIEPMRIKTDDPITSPGGWISVSADGLDEKVPYLTIFFNVRTGKTGFGAFEDKEVKVYVYDLADSYSEDVQKTMDDIDLSGEELESILGEYGLNKSFDEYESMSEEEQANYDTLAWLATMAMLPDEIPVPGTYTLPVGLDMTITYTVSVKGTLSDGDVSTTVEMQKKELKSLTLSKDNADLIITDDEISVNVKSEIEGLDTKIGGGYEIGTSGVALSSYLDEGESIREIKLKQNTDNSTSIIYTIETKVNQNSSVCSELEIKKENNDDNLPGWEPVGISILDNLPEPIRDLFENPVWIPVPVPVPAF